MGLVWSCAPQPTAEQRYQVIDPKRLEIKILLLGAGESGKSTILKQLRIIHQRGYTQVERMERRSVVYFDLLTSMMQLVDGASTLLGKHSLLHLDAQTQIIHRYLYTDLNEELPCHVFETIEKMWEDDVIRKVYDRRNEIQLNDSAAYFFDELDRIGCEHYMPTDDDILHTRVQTTGIQEMTYEYKSMLFHVYDVPGQRSQRRKWYQYFENVNAVLFVVAVSEYDQTIREDNKTNRMIEAIMLFGVTFKSHFFENCQPILFLNKMDLFVEKVKKVPIGKYFDDFTGPNEYENGMNFFANKFNALRKDQERVLYIHRSCATDTNQVHALLTSAADSVISKNLSSVGLQ